MLHLTASTHNIVTSEEKFPPSSGASSAPEEVRLTDIQRKSLEEKVLSNSRNFPYAYKKKELLRLAR